MTVIRTADVINNTNAQVQQLPRVNARARKQGIMSASRLGSAEGPEPEGGANALPSEAAERRENTCLGAALEGEYASGGGPDGCAEEPGAAAEGDAGGEARRRECTRCRAHGNTGSFRPLNGKSTCAMSTLPAPTIAP